MIKMREQKCRHCDGKGHHLIPDWDALRRVRKAAGTSLREMARRVRISAPYLSDIERGRRGCPPAVLAAYDKLTKLAAYDKLTKDPPK